MNQCNLINMKLKQSIGIVNKYIKRAVIDVEYFINSNYIYGVDNVSDNDNISDNNNKENKNK